MLDYLIKNHIGILQDVRQRLGAKNEDDTSYDDIIAKMSAKEIMAKWCGWNLGDEGWANLIINIYENIKSNVK